MGKTKVKKSRLKPTKAYAVTYGVDGVKDGFRKVATATDYAQKMADKRKEEVYVDQITSYPYKTVGNIDWSQRTIKTIKPKKK